MPCIPSTQQLKELPDAWKQTVIFVPSANIQNGISLNDRLSGSHYHIPHISQRWSSSHKLQTWHTLISWQTYTCSDAVQFTYIWKSIGVLVLMLDLERQRRYIWKSLRFWHWYWMKRRQCGWNTWKLGPCDNSQRRGIWFAVFIIGGHTYERAYIHSFTHTQFFRQFSWWSWNSWGRWAQSSKHFGEFV